jgi:hypothetical protein
MPDLDGFEQRRRHLPHWGEPGATYFVRFGLRRRTPLAPSGRRQAGRPVLRGTADGSFQKTIIMSGV